MVLFIFVLFPKLYPEGKVMDKEMCLLYIFILSDIFFFLFL